MICVEKYRAIPFRHQGCTFEGVDCLGFVRLFYKHELGIDLSVPPIDYDEQWWLKHNYLSEWVPKCGFAQTHAPKDGSVILFRNTTRTPGHLGVYIGDSYYAHMTRTGLCINSANNPLFNKLIDSIFDYNGD